jgi:hypothetical protein
MIEFTYILGYIIGTIAFYGEDILRFLTFALGIPLMFYALFRVTKRE